MGAPMTVCIAARAGDNIILASDRLLTAGDIQFEPMRQKFVQITRSICILTAGDAAFLTLVMPRVMGEAHHLISTYPNEWLLVRTVVDLYVRNFIEERAKIAERAILAPLGLTRETFLARQKTMDSDLVRKLASAMLDYQVPDCAVIIAGRDPEGAHIFAVEGTDVSAQHDIGFAAIGSGGRHANSQFMLARHAWHNSISDTLLLTYLAKRRSEAAPGVGVETDMMIIGPNLGDYVLVGDHVKVRLQQEFDKIIAAETGIQVAAKGEIAQYVQQITATANVPVADQAEKTDADTEQPYSGS